jgi:hypothetical protein
MFPAEQYRELREHPREARVLLILAQASRSLLPEVGKLARCRPATGMLTGVMAAFDRGGAGASSVISRAMRT